jgi:hypothetical protein
LHVLAVMEIQTRAAHPGRHRAPCLGLDRPAGRNLLLDPGDRGRFKFMIRDGDSKFTAASDGVFTGNGMRVIKTPIRANSFAERFVGMLRRERPDHILIPGEAHLRKVVAEIAGHCNGHRPHHSIQQAPPQPDGRAVDLTARIELRQVPGGLISEYRRAA